MPRTPSVKGTARDFNLAVILNLRVRGF